jgi:tRNA threonylcarbamoyladenosine modification (KEOPS) complex Cgi121 subunit
MNDDAIYDLQIPIETELKRFYFSILSIKIMRPEFSNLNNDEKLNLVLQIINEQREKFEGFIQLIALSECIGFDHIKYAVYHALKNIYKKNMISNLPENEILLYLTIQRQISKAYGSMGIKKEDFVNKYFEKTLLIISPHQDSIKEKISELKKNYEIKSISAESIDYTETIVEKANRYGIVLDRREIEEKQSVYSRTIAKLNEKMIKLTIDNLS